MGNANVGGGQLLTAGGHLIVPTFNAPSGVAPVVPPSTLIGGAKKGIAVGAGYEADEPNYFAALYAAGCRYLRVTFNWSAIEGGATRPGSKSWTSVQTLLAAAWDAGLETFALVTYTPQWARYPGFSTTDKAAVNPTQYAAFAEFIDDIVDRYKVGGSSSINVARPTKGIKWIEYWNEANFSVFRQPAPLSNMQLYFDELSIVYARVKAGAPTMFVGTSGCAPVGAAAPNIKSYDFIQYIIDRGIVTGYVQPTGGWGAKIPADFVCHHFYFHGRVSGVAVMPNGTANWNAFSYDPVLIHNRLCAAGYQGMEIWMTEGMAPHAPNAVTGSGNSDSANVYSEQEAYNAYIIAGAMWDDGSWVTGGAIPPITGGHLYTGVMAPFEMRCRSGQTGVEKWFGFWTTAGVQQRATGASNDAWEGYSLILPP